MNYQDEYGHTPLHRAAQEGHAAVTKQLIEARCNVDLPDKHGRTPLFMGTQEGHASVTKQLIDKDGDTPLHFTAQEGHDAVTKQLIAARCNAEIFRKTGKNRKALQRI